MNMSYKGPVEPAIEIKLADAFEVSVEQASNVEPKADAPVPAAPKERKLIAASKEQGMMHYSVRGVTKVL